MDRRTHTVAAIVEETIVAHGTTKEIVAQAADLSTHEREQLAGTRPLELAVLAEVGCLLRSPVSKFLEGVA